MSYKPDAVAEALASGEPLDDEGVEEAFDVDGEVEENIKTGQWVGDCFIYTNNGKFYNINLLTLIDFATGNRLNYYVGGEIVTISHLDRPMYLLGYLESTERLYLCDKDVIVVSYKLQQSVLEYQTAVMRGDLEQADAVEILHYYVILL